MIKYYLSSNNEMCYNTKTQTFSPTKHILLYICIRLFWKKIHNIIQTRPWIETMPARVSKIRFSLVQLFDEKCATVWVDGHRRSPGDRRTSWPGASPCRVIWFCHGPRGMVNNWLAGLRVVRSVKLGWLSSMAIVFFWRNKFPEVLFSFQKKFYDTHHIEFLDTSMKH